VVNMQSLLHTPRQPKQEQKAEGPQETPGRPSGWTPNPGMKTGDHPGS
jgi:hypothetical protein